MTCVHHPDSYRLYTDDAPGVEGSRPHEKGSTAYGAAGRGQFKSTVNLRRRPGGDVALTLRRRLQDGVEVHCILSTP